ncbi:MAG: hypothetical protein A3F17_08165 [Gammaproteobacteria bacterium RIFCSPHIGHO2_12_FULL_41_15]|nr:MAG: hypothetical protein A3F17_08165 [Gammaproteobacteria bacterium RIFCSPHIGHO2_12_FULL_41_15]
MIPYVIFVLLLLLAPTVTQADVYERKDAEGNAYYSDTPSAGAKKVQLPLPTIIHAPTKTKVKPVLIEPTIESKKPEEVTAETPSSEPTEMEAEEAETKSEPTEAEAEAKTDANTESTYTTFALTAPEEQQTFQNQRTIPVVLTVDPALRTGDKIQLLVDGEPYGDPQAQTGLTLQNLPRGTHAIQATLLDKTGQPIKTSNAATIYVHYANIGH